MKGISFTSEEKQRIVRSIQRYFDRELQQEIDRFDPEFLLDFFSTEIGVHFYNRGLLDAQAVLSAKLDDVQDAIGELERPTDLRR